MKSRLILVLLAAVIINSTAALGAGEAKSKGTRVLLHTSMGDITLQLYDKKAPATVRNFVQYVGDGYYSGTIFHRVISTFMIQGGGFTTDMVQKPTRDPVKNEADNKLKNKRGTIAMARTNAPHSATAQFFINVGNNESLNYSKTNSGQINWGYTVFGKVIDGMDVVDNIRFLDTTAMRGVGQYVPVEAVIIESAKLLE